VVDASSGISNERKEGSVTQACAEDALLNRWRAGDCAAGDELVRMCRPVLRWFFIQRTTENVDELVQRTLVACVQALDQFEGRSSFKTFLLGIANKQFLMSLRAERARESAPPPPSYRDPSPSQLFARMEEVTTVSAALNDTSPTFRRVLEMFYLDELSVDEIAKTLCVPPGTVKSRLSRGRTMLKARIEAVRRSKIGNPKAPRPTSLQPSHRADPIQQGRRRSAPAVEATTETASPKGGIELVGRSVRGNQEDEHHVA
jgi:RNA polymerase sigma-70 factor (ECF subfamily)